jgi:hypothetical protein
MNIIDNQITNVIDENADWFCWYWNVVICTNYMANKMLYNSSYKFLLPKETKEETTFY